MDIVRKFIEILGLTIHRTFVNRREWIAHMGVPDFSNPIILGNGTEQLPNRKNIPFIAPNDGFIIVRSVSSGVETNLGVSFDCTNYFNWTGSIQNKWASNITTVSKGQAFSVFFRYGNNPESCTVTFLPVMATHPE